MTISLGSSVFGAANTGSSMFGSAPAANTSTSLFGSSLATNTGSASLFGTAPATQSSFSLGSAFGTQPAQPQSLSQPFSFNQQATQSSLTQQSSLSLPSSQPQPPAAIDGTTVYSSLPDSMKSIFLQLEQHIKTQSNVSDELSLAIAHRQQSMTTLTNQLLPSNDAVAALSLLRVNLRHSQSRVDSLLTSTQRELRESEATMRKVSKLSPIQSQSQSPSAMDNAITLPSIYHWNLIAQFEQRYNEILQEIQLMEECLTNTDTQTYNSITDVDTNMGVTPATIAKIIQSQNDHLVSLTARISVLHAAVQDLRMKSESTLKESRTLTSVDTQPRLTLTSGLFAAAATPSTNTCGVSGQSQQSLFQPSASLPSQQPSLAPSSFSSLPGLGQPNLVSSFSLGDASGQSGQYRSISGRRPLVVKKK